MSELRKNLPPMGQLVAFEAAARLRNFTRTADELHISQAAVSRQIRELEQHLSAALFHRNRYDVSLTAAGEMFLGSIRPALLLMLGAVGDTRALERPRNEFTVYSDQSIDTSYLLPRLQRFLESCPEVELNLISSGRPIEDIRVNFDIAFQAGPIWSDDYETEAIADDEVFPVCSPAYLDRHPEISTPEGLRQAELLRFEQPGRVWTTWDDYLNWLGCQKGQLRQHLKFTRYPALLHAAESGAGIALGWRLSVSSRLESGTLVETGTQRLKIENYLHSYIRKGQPKNSLARDFLRWIRANP